ncbi:unnamed protein product [Ambrosiozyma monospora]|uniref:Unnamed protein product n=1 Tax=Ambrosiozyma monospora TaxID=43982 RepID=A0ACB5T8V3_AMBMO|nr:unnamed protein product [Ambrosiozyma monospora]
MEYDESSVNDPQSLLSVDIFTNHIYNIVKTLLSLESHLDLVNNVRDEQSKELLSRFISSVKESSLFILKTELEDNTQLRLVDEFNDNNHESANIIIVTKSRGQLCNNGDWQSQVIVTKIPTGYQSKSSNFEKLKSLINMGIVPYFNALSNAELNDSQSVNVTKKKFYELVLSLQHLQQNIPIPNLGITAHPKIKELVAQNPNSTHLAPNLLGQELLSDSNFLNSLQSIVNDWVRQSKSH